MIGTPWQEATDTLRTLTAEPAFGLITDMDGTISPLVLNPPKALVTERNRQALVALRDVLPLVAVVSGRKAAAVQHIVNIPGLVYIGNHGMDQWQDGQVVVAPQAAPYAAALQEVHRILAPLEQDGAEVEDKGASLSIHYRRAHDPQTFQKKAAPLIERAAVDHGMETFTGKMIFEVRPPIDIDKGVALVNLVEQYQLKAALFLGDDVTDLAAMRATRRLRQEGVCNAWSVGVHSEDEPEALADSADFFAAGVGDVEELLEWVLNERKASST